MARTDGLDVEAPSPVANEHLGAGLGELGVHGDRLHTGVPCCIPHRLGGGRHERTSLVVDRPVAHDHHIDLDPEPILDVGPGAPELRLQARVERRGDLVDVDPQLAVLGAGERPHPIGVAGVGLEQRQRLQHGVVEVGSDLGPLVGSLALGALALELRFGCEAQTVAYPQRIHGPPIDDT